MSDDFFSNASLGQSQLEPDTPGDFAHAISLRFGSADIRTARLIPGDVVPTNPHSTHIRPPSSPQTSACLPQQRVFASVLPSALPPYLADPRALILDIRPHAAHAAARVNHALSLSVPTTLLKRPLFSLSRLAQMLPSPSSRARFADWPSASRILVYDSDSVLAPDNSIITGLLRKFRAEGFTAELGWLRGGFQAVWKEARHLATTDLLTPEDDDPDPASSSGALRTTHLPKAAFSLFSTTAAHHPHLGPVPLPNTPATSAPRAANPFFDAIRQNVELSHGITERIPLCLSRRVRRRIHDLPFRWLQDIARRSALRHPYPPRHPSLDSIESGSESSDDPHTSDPDENDPNVEEGTEALAMQFYRIELAEQRRLRSIMEHHTRESELTSFCSSARSRTVVDKGAASIGADPVQGSGGVQSGAKSVPGTPFPFPFSITAGVEKGAKNRYTHIWPFEHARVRLHDSRHQGSHPSRRDKGKASGRGRSPRDRSGGRSKEREECERQDKQYRSRSSPAYGNGQDQRGAEMVTSPSRHSFCFEARSSVGTTVGFQAGPAHPPLSPSATVPRVKIEYDITVQDSRMSGPPTPVTALSPPTPPFYTPMETPMRTRPFQLSLPSGASVSPGGGRLGGAQILLQAPSPASLGSHPSSPLRLPSRSAGLLPSIGEQAQSSELLRSSIAPFGVFPNGACTVGEVANDTVTKCDLWTEPSQADDYVNASYVQPLGTRKRYIATQGPLPSTYVDFWTLVWEQNVHVIVMLTREVENAVVKCGSYWTDTEYGPLRLELVSTSPPLSPTANLSSMDISKHGFFAIREPQGKTSGASRDPTLITRTFALSHTSYPLVPPRKITHLQYLDWSDMNVPEDPQGVLDLVKRVEQAVAQSTPGPSPGGSMSPGSASGSLSDSPSLEAGSDRKRYDMSLLSPTRAGFIPGTRKRKRENEWRHPELDSKTGVAVFALGRAAPVLLHCSAGVGRTGGFIAVDAVLDSIRKEVRRSGEERRLKNVLGISAKGRVNDVDASGELSVESTETGIHTTGSHGEENMSDESGHMDVDEPTVDMAEKSRDQLHIINTIPLHVSAGDRKRRHHSGEKQCSSPESFVVHVPYAGTDGVPEDTNVAEVGLGDPRKADRQSSSTREWVEQVSDQVRVGAGERDIPPPPSLPSSSRGMSPGSTSNSSGPSAVNSADDSTNGSANASASGDKVDGKSHSTGSGTGSGSGGLPPGSKPGSGSISFSNSGSGTDTGSRFGSSLLHARLRESSVTSISAASTDSLPLEHELKLSAPLHRPSAIRISSSSDMEIDCPPRPVSVPLQPAHPNTMDLQRAIHLCHDRLPIGSSHVASFSTSSLPPATKRDVSFSGSDAAQCGASRPSSGPGSDGLPSPQELESGEVADAEGSGKHGRGLSDESEEITIPSKSGSNLQLDTNLGHLAGAEIFHNSGSAKNLLVPFGEAKCGDEITVLQVVHRSEDSAPQQIPATARVSGSSEHEQRAADHQVIDYKLPRELHSDLSPPLISSFAEPICMVIQDMREQRMSLCQSLRQYVFVHAAIIEGALRIVDEEHELWGSGGTSDDASSAEGETGATLGKGGRRSEAKALLRRVNRPKVAVTTPEREHGDTPDRTRVSHPVAHASNQRTPEGNPGDGQSPLIPTSSSVPSPSRVKRGPSPTELLREDKTGALSLNKRPSIQRETRNDEGDQFSLGSNMSSPGAGEGGVSRDVVVGVNVARCTPGRQAVPEMGGPTSGSAR